MSKFKRFLCLLTSLLLMCTMIVGPAITVSAEEVVVQPRLSYTHSASNNLDISSDGTASCLSYAEGYYGITTKVHIKMVLQKSIQRRWTDRVTWEGTFNDVWGAIDEITTVTTGTYRIKSIFTVYSGSDYEVIEAISPEKYIHVTT